MSSPSKRRRTSPSTYITVNGDTDGDTTRSRPTTPKRASYLSPTKASLARSNPNVLLQNSEARTRRESSPNRRQSLRDAVLGSRAGHAQDDVRPQNSGKAALTDSSTDEQQAAIPSGDQLADDIAKSFEQPMDTDISAPIQPRSPLRLRQPSVPPSIYTPSQDRSVPTITTPSIIPKLVQSTSKAINDEQNGNGGVLDDLPPTPVDLGRNVTGRPRGLVSSSPGGSSRRRVRGQNGTITSSPLKNHAPPPELSEDVLENMEVASGLGDEAEDIDQPSGDVPVDADLQEEMQKTTEDANDHVEEQPQTDSDDPVIRDKQDQLKALQDQLRALQTECSELEKLGTTISKLNNKTSDLSILEPSLDLLLSSIDEAVDPLNPPLESHPIFLKHPSKFLTLFAPGNLVMSYETWEKKVRGRQKFVYQTTFAAPRPWPPSTLNVTFETTIDLENDVIELITFTNSNTKPLDKSLEKWITNRLADPFLSCDLATLVTGVGRYFEQDVQRAKTFKQLVQQYPTPNISAVLPDISTTDTTSETLSLLPYMHRSQITFSSPTTTTSTSTNPTTPKQTRNSKSTPASRERTILLTYCLPLSWTGSISKPEIDIILSGSVFSADVVQHARKLFREVLLVKGLEDAVGAVWEVLGMDEMAEKGEKEMEGVVSGIEKGKGKARRMTEFN